MYGDFQSAYGQQQQVQEYYQQQSMNQQSMCKNGVCPIVKPKNLIFSIPDNNDDFNQILKEYPVIIVKAWANWCEPCKLASKKFHILAERYQNLIEAKQLLLLADNIDNPDSIHKSKVDVIPTFFIYINGKINPSQVLTGVDFDKLEHLLSTLFQH